MKPLPVNERFHTWQGEGVHTGKSAYFIRSKDARSNAHGVTRPGPGIRIGFPRMSKRFHPKLWLKMPWKVAVRLLF